MPRRTGVGVCVNKRPNKQASSHKDAHQVTDALKDNGQASRSITASPLKTAAGTAKQAGNMQLPH